MDINELVTKNFQENIAYLEKEHPKVFEKLAALDSAIANGHYKEKYELIYESGYFDVLENLTNKLLYGQNSHEFAELVSDTIDYNPNLDTFECFRNFSFTENQKREIKEDVHFENYLSQLVDTIDYTHTNSTKEKLLQSLDKFIFFGTGLGVHFDQIDKKISAKSYLVVEDDLELFRLSLFTTNYKKLSNKAKLYFSVFQDEHEFIQTANSFLNNEYYYNSYIKYFAMLSHSLEKRKVFHQQSVSQPHLTYYYNTMLTQTLKPLDYIFDNYKFLNRDTTLIHEQLNGLPFLLLAAGPSLQKNREWLKKNHQNFVIVAISAVLQFLEKENISPDIIIHLEGASHASKLFENISSFDLFKDSVCLFSSRTPSDVLNLFSKKQIFLFENSTKYKESSFKLMATCVGSISHQLLLLLKIKNIYLLGLDLAVNAEGKTHVDGHTRSKVLSLHDNKQVNYEKDLVVVVGNHNKEVHTTMQYRSSIDSIAYSSKLFQNTNQNIYNLGDGAFFKGTKPLQITSIQKLKEKKSIKPLIYEIFNTNSSKNLNKEDIKSLQEKLYQAQKIKVFIDTLVSKNNQTSDFIEDLKELSLFIYQSNSNLKYEIYTILDNYLHHILPIIFNFYNTKNLIDEDICTDSIKTIFSTDIFKIIDYYTESIGKFKKRV